MCLPTQSQHAHATQRTTERGGGSNEGGSMLTRDISSLDYAQRAHASRNHEQKGDEKLRQVAKEAPRPGRQATKGIYRGK